MGTNILSKEQIHFLEALGKELAFTKNFYLTGGTPLTVFYLEHRYSEDLDFFSEQEVDPLTIQVFLKSRKKDLKIHKIDFQQIFNRNLFFLHYSKDVLKAEFTFFPFLRLEKGSRQYGVTVDSLLDIAVNKLFTIYQRTQARDYIDLYCLCKKKGYKIVDLLKKAKIKFDWHIDPLQLGSQFMKAKDAEDVPRMIWKLSRQDWIDFFEAEAERLKNNIFE